MLLLYFDNEYSKTIKKSMPAQSISLHLGQVQCWLVSKIQRWCHLPVFLIRFQLGQHFRVDHSNLRCNIDHTAITCDLTKLSCQAEKNRKKIVKKRSYIFKNHNHNHIINYVLFPAKDSKCSSIIKCVLISHL